MLLVNAARFQLDNWVPRKVDVPLLVPHQSLTLDQFVGHGKQDGEVELPDIAPGERSPHGWLMVSLDGAWELD